MTQLQHWRLAITPLSPVHMGTGEDYEPTGYVIDRGALYEFDGIAALQALPVAERERLGRMLEQRPNEDMLRQVQSFFHQNRERLIAVSRHQVKVNSTIEAFYGERVGQVVQNEQGGRNVQNKLEIERTAYTSASGAAILPGSGLKGAIRTALLDAVNEGRPLPTPLKGDRQANRKLQEHLFKGKFHTDPLRLIRLGDAALTKPDNFSTEVRFALNRKKQAVKNRDGVLVQSQAEQHGLYQLLECLPSFQARAFDGSLSIQGTGGVESQDWPESARRFRLPEITVACNRFYRPKLDAELKLLRSRGYLDTDWRQRLQSLLDGPVGQSLDANNAFLLRVGRHSGAESVTLDGLRNIKIMKGKGEAEYLDHAKTLWLVGDERQIQTNLQPFGWLLVEPFDDPSQLPPWQEDAGNPAIAAWRTDVRERQAEMAAKLEQERKREAERKRAVEKAEFEATVRKAQLESLSEEGRKIEGLRELFAKDKAVNRKQAGGELASSLVALLKDAEENWQGQECAELADLALEIYGFIGWPASKKKRQRKAQIEAIRKKSGQE